MTPARIRRIERLSGYLVAGAILVSALFLRDQAVTLGVAVGGGLEWLNLHVMRRLLEAILASTSPQKQALIGVVLSLKFAVLATCIVLVLRLLPVSAVALLVGVTLPILAIVLEGLFGPRSGA